MAPMNALPSSEALYRAVLERDPSYDGVFFLGVRTTGIFCRPTCKSKKPLAENVEYFASTGEAERAGYRACKRCRPLEPLGAEQAWIRSTIAELGETRAAHVTDAELRELSIDPVRARRAFRAAYGVTFHGWQRSQRLGLALRDLRDGGAIDAVAQGRGWQSTSGFREAFEQLFGAPPGRARSADCLSADLIASPLGPLLAAASSRGICLLEFLDRRGLPGQASSLQRALGCAVVPGRNAHIDQMERELAEWFAGRRTRFDVALHVEGTDFERSVWKRLLEIPYGETMSYEAMAFDLGRPGAQRAVGRANGKNRIAIVIPCHRVVQKNGELRGYGGGLWRKRRLIDLERDVRAREQAGVESAEIRRALHTGDTRRLRSVGAR
jgi:AraC family transcriptional regulator of adaptative response/methylated-DNA-[protein]-cysteine methyltransferase